MMGKMVKNMIYFVVLLLVVLMSFGVCRQAILFPDSDPNWNLAREVFYQPYFMLYGEVFADSIDPPCGDEPGMERCQTGRWITVVVMSTYLLVANILLINLLIAVFNNIFIEVNAISHQVWMFQRFTVVMEYEQKPVLPPPLIILSHLYLLIKFLRRKVQGVQEPYDNGLKLFLDIEDLERLYDFEEEAVEGYFREKETRLHQSTEERIKQTTDRVENMYQKIEDINHKESNQNLSIQAVEFRLRKLEELAEQTASTLSVIHRFMTVHSRTGGGPSNYLGGGIMIDEIHAGSIASSNAPGSTTSTDHRPRRPSEHSEGLSDISEVLGERLGNRLEERLNTHTPIGERFGVQRKRGPLLMTPSIDVRPDQSSVECLTFGSGSKVGPANSQATYEETSNYDTEESDTTKLSNQISEESTEDTIGVCGGGRIQSGSQESSLLFPMGRQLSQTHSEPDTGTGDSGASVGLGSKHQVERSVTWAEPRIKVIPPASHPRSALLSMHHEYTSITDELETVCGLLSPPKSPSLLTPLGHRTEQHTPTRRSRHHSEMSNPEMARYLEKETLRDAEDSDYQLMEGLIQKRLKSTDEDKYHNNAFFLATTPDLERYQGRLRRASAIEGDFPSTTNLSTIGTPIGLSPDDPTSSRKLSQSDKFINEKDISLEQITINSDENLTQVKSETPSMQRGSSDSDQQLRSTFSTSKIFNKMQKEVQL